MSVFLTQIPVPVPHVYTRKGQDIWGPLCSPAGGRVDRLRNYGSSLPCGMLGPGSLWEEQAVLVKACLDRPS